MARLSTRRADIFTPKCVCLRVTIWTKQSAIRDMIPFTIPIYVIKLQTQWLTIPFLSNTAFFTKWGSVEEKGFRRSVTH